MDRQGRCITMMLLLITYLSISSYLASKGIGYRIDVASRTSKSNKIEKEMNEVSYVDYAKDEYMTRQPVGVNFKQNVELKLERLLETDSADNIGKSTPLFFVPEEKAMPENASTDSIQSLFVNIKGKSGVDETLDICKSLVSGIDKIRWRAMQKVKSCTRKSGVTIHNDRNLTRIFSDCPKLSRIITGLAVPPRSNERPIAYSILLNRPGHQTIQLLRAIYNPLNVYCLHVSTGATKRFISLINKIADCVRNIFIAPGRFRVSYATFERIKAHMSCYKTLLNSKVSWRYLISIPGSVFPLRNNTFIADYLEKRHYANSISYGDASHQSFIKRTSFVHKLMRHPDGYDIFSRTKKRKQPVPGNITLFRSDSSFIATRSFAEFVTNSTVARDLLRWSKDVKNPEEFFWATLDRLPGTPGGTPYRTEWLKFEGTVTDPEDVLISQENDLLAKLWKSQHTPKCGGVYFGNLCVFNYKDLRWLVGQDSLFADAFDLKIDAVAIGCLYRNLQRPLIEDFF